jgi:hypothetical protein
MKTMINMLKNGDAAAQLARNRYLAYSTMSADARERSNQSAKVSQITAEYWIRGIMWLLVAVTAFWDVTVTFGPHLEWTRRFF